MGKLLLHCDGIVCDNEVEFEIPLGWLGDAEAGGDGHYVYCLDCQLQGDFFWSQCGGCVESFPDCRLAKAFMFARSRKITEAHKATIRAGFCPLRTNGTIVFSPDRGVESIDLSEKAPAGSGAAVVDAIEAYIAKYTKQHEESNDDVSI